MTNDEISVVNNTAAKRFEAETDGRLAMIQYIQTERNITFTHTEVPVELEGQGVASQMAKVALDFACDNNLKVIPICPFVAAYIRHHPEYQPLVYGYKPRESK